MTEQQPPAVPVPCRTCDAPVVKTEVGWTHVDSRGVLTGWVCALPYMGIAQPDELAQREELDPGGRRRPTPIPPSSRTNPVTPPTHYPGL